MKKHFLVFAAFALPLLSATPSHAGIDPAIVSADARWLVYADLDSLREGAIGKELIAFGEKMQIDTAGGKLGIDWQKFLATIGSATAYGTNISPDPKQIDGTLVIQGSADFRKIAESALIQLNLANPKAVAEITDLPFSAYVAMNTQKEGAERQEVVIAFPPEPIVIISKSKPQILKARDVFRGAAPSLAKTPTSPLAKFVHGADGAYLFAASAVPAEKFFPDDGPQARILKMADAGSLALGERGENTFAHVELVANSDQMAEKLMKIMQGMTAMMSLAETNDKQLADFLNSAAVDRHGDAVTLDVAYASARLAAMIKSLNAPAGRPQDRAASRVVQMVNGRALAEWQAEAGPAAPEGSPAPVTSRAVENVTLKNGSLITLARNNNGGKSVRFDRIEIAAADGTGAPLTFRSGYMRTSGPRGNWQQFEFPGADGTYRLKVFYVNDPEGKASFAVSARDPVAPAAAAAPSGGSTPPAKTN